MALSFPQQIPDTAIDLTPVDPAFQQSFTDTVGDAGTSTDGFDFLFNQIALDMATIPDLISSMDPDLSDIGLAFVDLATPWEKDFGDALTTAITQGDPTFQAYNIHLTGGNPPPPGGGGGGGNSDGCLQFDFGTVPNTNETGSAVYKHVFGLQNNTNKVVKIVKTTITPTQLSNTFIVSPSITGKTIAVNATLSVTVLLQLGNPPQGKIQANLAIQTDAPDPQPCIDLFANSVQGPTPGGGGGGGGGGGCGSDDGGFPAECASPNPLGVIQTGGLKWIP